MHSVGIFYYNHNNNRNKILWQQQTMNSVTTDSSGMNNQCRAISNQAV
jgi:hypothetical protein